MMDMKSILQKLAFQQGREELSPEEEALLLQQQQQPDPMERILLAQGPNPADVLAQNPNSVANRLMNRRRALEEAGGIQGEDSVPSAQGYAPQTSTRAAPSFAQEEQLIKMLKGRGMTDSEARARAKGMR